MTEDVPNLECQNCDGTGIVDRYGRHFASAGDWLESFESSSSCLACYGIGVIA